MSLNDGCPHQQVQEPELETQLENNGYISIEAVTLKKLSSLRLTTENPILCHLLPYPVQFHINWLKCSELGSKLAVCTLC